jgi:hypothetical protein
MPMKKRRHNDVVKERNPTRVYKPSEKCQGASIVWVYFRPKGVCLWGIKPI